MNQKAHVGFSAWLNNSRFSANKAAQGSSVSDCLLSLVSCLILNCILSYCKLLRVLLQVFNDNQSWIFLSHFL